MQQKHRRIVFALFAGYGLMMLWLLLLRRIPLGSGAVRLNLEPLDTLKRYIWVLRHSTVPVQRRYALANLLGNVALFLPLGIFLPMLFGCLRSFRRFAVVSILLVLMVELCQLLTGLGACDVDDWLLNVIGSVAGWSLWRLWPGNSGKITKEST